MENGRKLLRGIALAAIAVIGLGGIALFASPSLAAQTRPDVIRIDAIGQLKKLEMPPAVFLHDEHTKALAATGQDCSVCHTPTANGHTVKFQRKEDGTDAKKLENIYHNGCIGCHENMASNNQKTGPLDGECRACHDTKLPFKAEQKPVKMGSKPLHYLHVSSKAIVNPANSEENCGVCHHVYDEKLNKLVWKKGQEDACAACHGEKAVGSTPSLQTAVHTKCVWCHENVAQSSRAYLTAQVEAKKAAEPKSTKKLSAKEVQAEAAAEAASIEAAIVTGPTTCAGCHTEEAQSKFKQVNPVPRLMRGQPDATVLLPVNNAKRPVGAPEAGMKPVVFNHKAHEASVDSCRTCHHVRIESCTVCHTVDGNKDGNFVKLADAMHAKTSDSSCVGCHQQTVMQKKECAGCHGAVPVMPADSCATCHKDVKGITSAQIADGSAFDLTKEQLADIAAKDLAAQPAPAKPFPAVEVPETVTIGALSNDFEPSVFPHRKIYEALVKGAADSGLASAFHTSPTAMCAACHHNSPIADLKTPPKCASCHGIEADKMATSVNKPSLKAAYHQQCMACHDRMKIEKPAATDCAGCHTPRVK